MDQNQTGPPPLQPEQVPGASSEAPAAPSDPPETPANETLEPSQLPQPNTIDASPRPTLLVPPTPLHTASSTESLVTIDRAGPEPVLSPSPSEAHVDSPASHKQGPQPLLSPLPHSPVEEPTQFSFAPEPEGDVDRSASLDSGDRHEVAISSGDDESRSSGSRTPAPLGDIPGGGGVDDSGEEEPSSPEGEAPDPYQPRPFPISPASVPGSLSSSRSPAHFFPFNPLSLHVDPALSQRASTASPRHQPRAPSMLDELDAKAKEIVLRSPHLAAMAALPIPRLPAGPSPRVRRPRHHHHRPAATPPAAAPATPVAPQSAAPSAVSTPAARSSRGDESPGPQSPAISAATPRLESRDTPRSVASSRVSGHPQPTPTPIPEDRLLTVMSPRSPRRQRINPDGSLGPPAPAPSLTLAKPALPNPEDPFRHSQGRIRFLGLAPLLGLEPQELQFREQLLRDAPPGESGLPHPVAGLTATPVGRGADSEGGAGRFHLKADGLRGLTEHQVEQIGETIHAASPQHTVKLSEFVRILSGHVTLCEDDLALLFREIDAKATGRVSRGQFNSYLAETRRAEDVLTARRYNLQIMPPLSRLRHLSNIELMIYVPHAKEDYLLTCGRDSRMHVWVHRGTQWDPVMTLLTPDPHDLRTKKFQRWFKVLDDHQRYMQKEYQTWVDQCRSYVLSAHRVARRIERDESAPFAQLTAKAPPPPNSAHAVFAAAGSGGPPPMSDRLMEEWRQAMQRRQNGAIPALPPEIMNSPFMEPLPPRVSQQTATPGWPSDLRIMCVLGPAHWRDSDGKRALEMWRHSDRVFSWSISGLGLGLMFWWFLAAPSVPPLALGSRARRSGADPTATPASSAATPGSAASGTTPAPPSSAAHRLRPSGLRASCSALGRASTPPAGSLTERSGHTYTPRSGASALRRSLNASPSAPLMGRASTARAVLQRSAEGIPQQQQEQGEGEGEGEGPEEQERPMARLMRMAPGSHPFNVPRPSHMTSAIRNANMVMAQAQSRGSGAGLISLFSTTMADRVRKIGTGTPSLMRAARSKSTARGSILDTAEQQKKARPPAPPKHATPAPPHFVHALAILGPHLLPLAPGPPIFTPAFLRLPGPPPQRSASAGRKTILAAPAIRGQYTIDNLPEDPDDLLLEGTSTGLKRKPRPPLDTPRLLHVPKPPPDVASPAAAPPPSPAKETPAQRHARQMRANFLVAMRQHAARRGRPAAGGDKDAGSEDSEKEDREAAARPYARPPKKEPRTGAPRFVVRPSDNRKLGAWAVAGVHVPALNAVFISTLRGAVIGYEDRQFTERARVAVPAPVTCIQVVVLSQAGTLGAAGRVLLACGDNQGTGALYDPQATDHKQQRVLTRPGLHGDFMTAIFVHPNGMDLYSAGYDGRLIIADLHAGWQPKVTLQGPSPIYDMAVFRARSMVATGCQDGIIRVWNPTVQTLVDSLKGHRAPVIKCVADEERNLLISAAADKCIRLWDIRLGRCLQMLLDPMPHQPENAFTSTLYDPAHHTLYTAGHFVREWPMNVEYDQEVLPGAPAHLSGVRFVLMSNPFNELVSIGADNRVNVWNLITGQVSFSWLMADQTDVISAATLDHRQRRLITGDTAGVVRYWNFHTGTCLRVLEARRAEITGLCYMPGWMANPLVAVGWDRKVVFTPEKHGAVPVRSSALTGHTEEITCCAMCNKYAGPSCDPYLIDRPAQEHTLSGDAVVTGDAGGNLLFWHSTLLRLNYQVSLPAAPPPPPSLVPTALRPTSLDRPPTPGTPTTPVTPPPRAATAPLSGSPGTPMQRAGSSLAPLQIPSTPPPPSASAPPPLSPVSGPAPKGLLLAGKLQLRASAASGSLRARLASAPAPLAVSSPGEMSAGGQTPPTTPRSNPSTPHGSERPSSAASGRSRGGEESQAQPPETPTSLKEERDRERAIEQLLKGPAKSKTALAERKKEAPPQPPGVLMVFFLGQKNMLAAISADGRLHLYAMATKSWPLANLVLPALPSCMAVDCPNSRILFGTADGSLMLYDIAGLPETRPTLKKQWQAHQGPVVSITCACKSPNLFASASADGNIQLYDMEGTLRCRFGQTEPWPALAFEEDDLFAMADEDDTPSYLRPAADLTAERSHDFDDLPAPLGSSAALSLNLPAPGSPAPPGTPAPASGPGTPQPPSSSRPAGIRPRPHTTPGSGLPGPSPRSSRRSGAEPPQQQQQPQQPQQPGEDLGLLPQLGTQHVDSNEQAGGQTEPKGTAAAKHPDDPAEWKSPAKMVTDSAERLRRSAHYTVRFNISAFSDGLQ
ncbi:hypothetical protein PAPYR_6905 [Paratrimastix pyriformis]|uniref:Guanine nucleotide-binding protein subunit beta-like protein n=1 Tax=Paratrimastix pyriformis TaxID=342808 RepID=A0ABQ8UJD1_9EUKA|nr:hypothetical protein PAPYR_6905 [Paratrimastix pyriformis]